MFLERGTLGGVRVLGPATVAAMTSNQIPGVGMQFDDEYFAEASWGLGWSIHGSRQPRRGGSLYSAQAFEHNGLGVSPNTQRRPLADTSKAATEGQVGS